MTVRDAGRKAGPALDIAERRRKSVWRLSACAVSLLDSFHPPSDPLWKKCQEGIVFFFLLSGLLLFTFTRSSFLRERRAGDAQKLKQNGRGQSQRQMLVKRRHL